jgi:hypothetical protein
VARAMDRIGAAVQRRLEQRPGATGPETAVLVS